MELFEFEELHMKHIVIYVHGKGGPAGRLTARTGGERSLALGERSGAGRGETVAAAPDGGFLPGFLPRRPRGERGRRGAWWLGGAG